MATTGWFVDYTVDCSGVSGGQGIFTVLAYRPGDAKPAEAIVNLLGVAKTTTTAHALTSGPVYLKVGSSGCTWSLSARTG